MNTPSVPEKKSPWIPEAKFAERGNDYYSPHLFPFLPTSPAAVLGRVHLRSPLRPYAPTAAAPPAPAPAVAAPAPRTAVLAGGASMLTMLARAPNSGRRTQEGEEKQEPPSLPGREPATPHVQDEIRTALSGRSWRARTRS